MLGLGGLIFSFFGAPFLVIILLVLTGFACGALWGITTNGYDNDNDKSFISFWIATGRQGALAMTTTATTKATTNNNGKKVNGNTETATPHPALSRKGGGEVENGNGILETATPHRVSLRKPSSPARGEGTTRLRQRGKQQRLLNTPPFGHPFSTKRGI
jgi:hypothetical protein